MKKYLVLITLIMVLALSTAISAYDYYITGAEDYEDMLYTADIENAVGYGEGQYDIIKVLAYQDSNKLENVLKHNFEFEYGLYENGEIYGSYYSYPDADITRYDLNVKHKFLEKNEWVVSGVFSYYYDKGYNNYKTPSAEVLTNKRLNSRLVLHNNLRLYFYKNDDIGKSITNGLTYLLNENNTLKVKLYSHTKDKISDFKYHNLELAIQSIIDEKTTYTGYVYTRFNDSDNDDAVKFSNTIEHQLRPDIKLTADLYINTGDKDNEIYGMVEKELDNDITLSGEYFTELGGDVQRLSAKVQKDFNNGFNVFGQYNNDLDDGYGIDLGFGFDL